MNSPTTTSDFRLMCLIQGQLSDLVLYFVDDFDVARQTNFPRLPVDYRPNIVLLAIFRTAGLLDGLFHRLQDLFAINRFLACNCIRDLQQFGFLNDGRFHHFLTLALVVLLRPTRPPAVHR